MVYIYDILLNFNKNVYEFFEWLDTDQVLYVKKIPIIRVDSKFIYDVINNRIKVNNDFLSSIFSKTKFYDEYLDDKYKYVCIFSDGFISVGVNFINNKATYVSRLLLDEERDVFSCIVRQNEEKIDYVVCEKRDNNLISRCDRENQKSVRKKIIDIYNNKEYDRLKYLYLEYFKEEGNDILDIYNRFIYEIDNNYNDSFVNIISLINLSKI